MTRSIPWPMQQVAAVAALTAIVVCGDAGAASLHIQAAGGTSRWSHGEPRW